MIMKSRSNDNLFLPAGFSLIESAAAVALLAIIASSSLLVIDRCMSSAADIKLRQNAFEVIRENIETN